MIVIRADGNAKIGAGHLMRCLTVAEAMGKVAGNRENICFLCADEQSADLVREHGFRAEVLDTDYREMETELPVWKHYLSSDPDMKYTILVDSYYVTDHYLEELRPFGKVYLLDDMQAHTYPVDVVINYNAFADADVYQNLYRGAETQILAGSKYAPIREQFLGKTYRVAKQVKNVLISTGGGDLENITGAILQKLYQTDMEFHIVTGRFNPHLEELKAWEREKDNVHIYHDVKNMADLMQDCDVAITAGGTTVYELAAIGVPFICFSYAENQEALTEYVGEHQIAGFAGAYHKDSQMTLERMRDLFTKYCNEYDIRKNCCEAEQNMIDGRGAERIAQMLQMEEQIWK